MNHNTKSYIVKKDNTKKTTSYLRCNKACGNCQVKFENFEIVIESLKDALNNYKLQIKKEDYEEKGNASNSNEMLALNNLENELKELDKQKIKLYDFLERGIYNEDVFLERSENLQLRIKETKGKLDEFKKQVKIEKPKSSRNEIIEGLKNAIELYPNISDIERKNALLKKVIKKIYYTKEPYTKQNDFKVAIELNLDIN